MRGRREVRCLMLSRRSWIDRHSKSKLPIGEPRRVTPVSVIRRTPRPKGSGSCILWEGQNMVDLGTLWLGIVLRTETTRPLDGPSLRRISVAVMRSSLWPIWFPSSANQTFRRRFGASWEIIFTMGCRTAAKIRPTRGSFNAIANFQLQLYFF